MRSAINRINHRFHQMKPGSVLILVVALLVLMALIGTAFLSGSQVDRYSTQQNTSNTETYLLSEGVKNMAKALIVGSLYDPTVLNTSTNGNTFKPANSVNYHNWTAPDFYHQFSNDPNIGTLANDIWLSPRTPSLVMQSVPGSAASPLNYSAAGTMVPVWPVIAAPAIGNSFESPFVQQANASGVFSNVFTVSNNWTDRMTAEYAPPSSTYAGGALYGRNISAIWPQVAGGTASLGSQLTPTFATINYPDGTSATFPAFQINVFNSAAFYANNAVPPTLTGTYKFLAGDADGDGIADCGMFKLPVGQLNGLTYYAGLRIVDNNSAVDVTHSLSRRYDFDGNFLPTRYWNGGAVAFGPGLFNLGCFGSNIGLAEMLHSNNGAGTTLFGSTGSIGLESAAWALARLGQTTVPPVFNGIVTAFPVTTSNLNGGSGPISEDGATARTDFAYTTLGDALYSQLGRRPEVPGYVAAGTRAVAASPADAAALAYHFVFRNPNASPSPLESLLQSSIYTSAPNGTGTIANRSFFSTNHSGVDSYVPSDSTTFDATVGQWYAENFDWDGTGSISGTGVGTLTPESCMTVGTFTTATPGVLSPSGALTDLPRRSILTALSTTSNIVPLPNPSFTVPLPPSAALPNVLPANTTMAANAPLKPYTCKTSINTAPFDELWRAFWLTMSSDNGYVAMSPLGSNGSFASSAGTLSSTIGGGTLTLSGHDLVGGQSVFTGSQFTQSPPSDINGANGVNNQSPETMAATQSTDPEHPQRMFRSSLRIPANAAASNMFYQQGTWSNIPADQMAVLRSAVAAVNVEAMRDVANGAASIGSSANIHYHDLPLTNVTLDGVANQTVFARVFGVNQQPFITEVYANTESNTPDATTGMVNSNPYVAVELFNPYTQDINLAGWQLAILDRSPTASPDYKKSLSTTTVLYTFTAGQVVPGSAAAYTPGMNPSQGGYVLLENYGVPGMTYRPTSTNLPIDGTSVSRGAATGVAALNDYQGIPLQQAIGKELVLLRPVTAGAAEASGIDEDPVDSYDFTGLVPGSTTTADVWHYVRANASNNASSNGLWRFIYPGRYDASDPTPYAATASSAAASPLPTGTGLLANPGYSAYSRRQQGTEAAHWNPTAATGGINGTHGPVDPFEYSLPKIAVTLGGGANGQLPGNDNSSGASYPVTFPFQYLNNDQPGPNIVSIAGVNRSPFGVFSRNSDMLQVPFVGSYIILSAAPPSGALAVANYGNLIEMNSMPMDCSFAEDTDVNDDGNPSTAASPSVVANPDTSNTLPLAFVESVGHFAPIHTALAVTYPNPPSPLNYPAVEDGDWTLQYLDPNDPFAAYRVRPSGGAVPQYSWRYRWAARLFDYLTVQAPSDDYFPNVNPATYPPAAAPAGVPVGVVNSYSSSVAGTTAANPHLEDTVPTYGQINLNTAPWRVLAALRFCPYDDADPRASQFIINAQTGSVNLTTTPPLTSPVTPPMPAGSTTNVPDNVQLAKAIVAWRDKGVLDPSTDTYLSNHTPVDAFEFRVSKGPFNSISDLLRVPAVQNYIGSLSFNNGAATPLRGPEPDANFGHLSPDGVNAYPTRAPTETDGVRNDVEERYDLLDRIGNQATVRSDTFTVYIVVQGWRNAGSSNPSTPPQLVTQRRAAFFVDRSSVNPTNTEPRVYPIPQE